MVILVIIYRDMAAPALSLFRYIEFKTHLIIIQSLLQLIASLGCYSRFSRDVTAAMLVYRTIAKQSFRNSILLLCKTWATFCHYLVHQHGRLLAWVTTITFTSTVTQSCHTTFSVHRFQTRKTGLVQKETAQPRSRSNGKRNTRINRLRLESNFHRDDLTKLTFRAIVLPRSE